MCGCGPREEKAVPHFRCGTARLDGRMPQRMPERESVTGAPGSCFQGGAPQSDTPGKAGGLGCEPLEAAITTAPKGACYDRCNCSN